MGIREEFSERYSWEGGCFRVQYAYIYIINDSQGNGLSLFSVICADFLVWSHYSPGCTRMLSRR